MPVTKDEVPVLEQQERGGRTYTSTNEVPRLLQEIELGGNLNPASEAQGGLKDQNKYIK